MGTEAVTATPAPDSRAVLLATVTEKQFQRQVETWAKRAGWVAYHTYDSRRSSGGFPDLVLCKPPGPVLYVELKTMKGRISPQQQSWLDTLNRSQGTVVCVWRPDMEDDIKWTLGLRANA